MPSSIVDEFVNVSLPSEIVSLPPSNSDNQRSTMLAATPPGYHAASTSLSQTLGRVGSYLSHSSVSLFTFMHHLGEMQDWFDNVPEPLRRIGGSPHQSKAVNLLHLRWLDAIMVTMRPFLAALARYGTYGTGTLPSKLSAFFTFCANVASIAARETLAYMRQMETQRLIKGLTAFDRHFLVQSAGILALSSVVQLGKRDERLRFRECIEMLLRLPGGRYGYLIRDMRSVEHRLERFASMKAHRSAYVFKNTFADDSDAANIFDSPGLPSLAVKLLLPTFIAGEQNGEVNLDEKEENLSKWIPKRVVWEDVPECIDVGLTREGYNE
jgi:hypothetical protein